MMDSFQLNTILYCKPLPCKQTNQSPIILKYLPSTVMLSYLGGRADCNVRTLTQVSSCKQLSRKKKHNLCKCVWVQLLNRRSKLFDRLLQALLKCGGYCRTQHDKIDCLLMTFSSFFFLKFQTATERQWQSIEPEVWVGASEFPTVWGQSNCRRSTQKPHCQVSSVDNGEAVGIFGTTKRVLSRQRGRKKVRKFCGKWTPISTRAHFEESFRGSVLCRTCWVAGTEPTTNRKKGVRT